MNSNHKLTVDEIAELRFINLNYSFDSFIVGTTFEMLDKNALSLFKGRISKAGRFKPTGNIKNDLIKLDLINIDGKITRACELLFGNHHTNIHIGRFKSQTTIIDDIMIRSPLILAIEEAIDFIKKNIRLGFVIGGDTLQREERWQYPISALREVLLNAIVHRDYTNPTDVIIKIYDESIEITNPGKLIGGLTVEDLKSDNYTSKHRNKLTTEAFYLTGDIEKYGTGFKRLREWFSEYPELEFNVFDLTDSIQVKIETIEEQKSNRSVNGGLNGGLNDVINAIGENPGANTKRISEIINIPLRTVERWVSELKKINKIVFKGSKKTGGYFTLKGDP